jgi:hypothetical protein
MAESENGDLFIVNPYLSYWDDDSCNIWEKRVVYLLFADIIARVGSRLSIPEPREAGI